MIQYLADVSIDSILPLQQKLVIKKIQQDERFRHHLLLKHQNRPGVSKRLK